MTIAFLDMDVSLDDFVSSPDPAADLGLHDWCFAPEGASAGVLEELKRSIGAMPMGRGITGDDEFETPYKVPTSCWHTGALRRRVFRRARPVAAALARKHVGW